MTDSKVNQENTANEDNAAAAVAPRDHNTVIGLLKNSVGKLARQEAKAIESDKLAATFNAEIIEMATGVTPQTATHTIQIVSTEQAKHVKRAAKIRATNVDLAKEIRDLNVELDAMLTELLLPYAPAPVADDSAESDESADSAESSEDENETED